MKKTPQGLLAPDGSPVPLLGVAVAGRLQGRAAEITVAQRYRNTGAIPLETTYVFPLPADAAVCGLEVRTGDRVLRGAVEERELAFDLYDAAMARGDGAFLLDQERENVYCLSVGNLLPGEEALVELRLCWRAERAGGTTRLTVPTTVAPRYAPGSLTGDQRREIERTTPDYALEVPYGFSLALDVEAGAPLRSVESPSHPVRVSLAGTGARVELARGGEAMDRDFVLLVEAEAAGAPQLLAAAARGREHLLLELDPDIPPVGDEAPRDVRFLVDCSGSMDGDSIAEARRAVELCLRALRAGDRFQVARFGSTFHLLSPRPLAYAQGTLDETVAAVGAMRADLGGTEILPALEALAQSVEGRADLIVLTDGEVANEDAVLSFLGRERGRPRVFSFGIGAASSEALVRGMARATGGAAEFIAPGERIEAKVLRQFGRVFAPALEEVRVDWGVAGVEQAPADIPPLFPGDTVAVAARLPGGSGLPEGAEVTISGRTARGPVSWTATAVRLPEGGAVPLWWARERIRDLEAGHGLPAGSRQERGGDRQKRALVALSKEYGVVSSETSYVAIEERAEGGRAQGPAELRRIPVMLAAGWHGSGRVSGGAAAHLVRECRYLPKMFLPADINRMACDTRDLLPPAPRGEETLPKYMSRKGAGRAPEEVFQERVLRVLAHQRADGSFLPLDGIAPAVGAGKRTLAALRKRVPAATWTDSEAVIATALALAFLATQGAAFKGIWRAAAAKARKWLGTQGGKGDVAAVLECAEEALGS